MTEDAGHRQRARLANMRQELLAPVNALVGYGEILHEEATSAGPADAVADIERILSAGRDLFGQVDRLLDQDLTGASLEGTAMAAVQKKLRHDLREKP